MIISNCFIRFCLICFMAHYNHEIKVGILCKGTHTVNYLSEAIFYKYNVYSDDGTPVDSARLFYGRGMKEDRENG